MPFRPREKRVVERAENLFSSSRQRIHGNVDAAFGATLKANAAVNQSEDGVVTTNTNVSARLHLRAALADDDIASDNLFATEFFNAKTASGAVAPVAG
ncbi:hypothetical protein HK19_07585 [Acetobacter persici]|nr:hypothetical protein HK19_07585 [Acetobacter persici]